MKHTQRFAIKSRMPRHVRQSWKAFHSMIDRMSAATFCKLGSKPRLTLSPRLEELETRYCFSGWQNDLLPCDVDASGLVAPIDVLIVINHLQRTGFEILPPRDLDLQEPWLDVNADGYVSPIDALLVINALNRARSPMTIVGGVDVTSDPNRNGVVLAAEVTITGQTLPGSVVTWTVSENPSSNSNRKLVNEFGQFKIQIPLSEATNTVRVVGMDEIGRKKSFTVEVRQGDIITDWNAASLSVIRDWTTTSNDPYQGRIVTSQPPLVARNLAMIHAAMFDAINATSGKYAAYAVASSLSLGASPVAAAAAAAYRVASSLYADSDEIVIWDATLAESLATIANDTARANGLSLGRQIGDAILALRSNDGATGTSTYSPGNDPGDWNRTFPDNLPPLLPQWPNVTPFAIPKGDSFRPSAPPSLSSSEYAVAVDEVMRLGRFESSERTAEQTKIALFWADGGGTATPPGHWNRIAMDVIHREHLLLIDSARTMAFLNLALADAGIASWDAKYHYDLWRPIDAIRDANTDGNSETLADTNWFPLLKTPPFSTYTSGHSTFSGAAAAVLTKLFGENYAFTSTTDGQTGLAQRPLAESKIVTRHFTSFNQAAEEAGMSRIYGGIHFSFDNVAGLETGKQIGEYIVSRYLAKVSAL